MIVLKIIGWILLGILGLVAAALVIACVAMCFRVRLRVEYSDENTSVLLKYLFLKIPVYPSAKKDKPDSGDKKEKNKNNKDNDDAAGNTAAAEAASAKTPVDEDGTENNATENGGESDKENEAADKKTESAPTAKKSGITDLLKTVYGAEGIDGLMLIGRRSCDYLGTFFGGLLKGFIVDDFQLLVRCSKSDAASTAIYYGEVCSALFPLLASLAASCRLKKHDINVYPDYLARYSAASFILDLYFTPIVMVGRVLALGVKFIFGVALQLLVKIFLYLKGSKGGTENKNKNLKEKSEVTNE